MNDDMPWVIGLTDEEIQELRSKKQELTEYGKQKIRQLMNKKPTLYEKLEEWVDYGNFAQSRHVLVNEIVNIVKDWLPPEHDTNDYQWNKCIKMMKENLR
jgi:acetyl-CoA carboxylase carboxyltransferase component